MNIDSIKNGYVIDHIKPGNAIKIINILDLNNLDIEIALIRNAKSKKSIKKDIIKIGELINLDYDKIASIDSNVTINIIKNDKIVEKKKLEVPKIIKNIYKCKNPRCITSSETSLDNIFELKESNTYRCIYCENKLDI